MAMLEYEINEIEPEFSDPELKGIFRFIKRNLLVGKQKWKDKSIKRAKAGSKGGKQTQANQANQANAAKCLKNKQERANQADSVSVSVSVSESESVKDKETTKIASPSAGIPPVKTEPEPKEPKSKFGKYQNVLLTAKEAEKISAEPEGEALVEHLSEYMARRHYKAKSHYLCLMGWVKEALAEKKRKMGSTGGSGAFKTNAEKLKEQEEKLLEDLKGEGGFPE